MHAAATMSGMPQEYEAATTQGTRDRLDAARAAGVRRSVHLSSVGVHSISRRPEGGEITEDSPLEADPAFLSHYVRSKIGSEEAARQAMEAGGMEVVVLRPGVLYGPRGNWKLSRIGYPVGRSTCVIIGNGKNVLPVCYVTNCARAVLAAVRVPAAAGEVINVVDDEGFTQIEYLRRLKADVRPRLRIVRFPYVLALAVAGVGAAVRKVLPVPCPIRRPHLVGCRRRLSYRNAKAKHVLGWWPATDKETALARTTAHLAEAESVTRRADIRLLGKAAGPDVVTACVVGCGMIGQEHLRVLSKMPNARVTAVCDSNADAANSVAAKFGVPRTYADPAAMLAEEKPKVLHVLAPPQAHADLTRLAAGQGCHVLVEKPMAMDAAAAREMARAAEEACVILCVDHNKLYDPVVVRARRIIESGELGNVVWAEGYFGFDLGSNLGSRYMLPGGERHWTFDIPGGLYQNLIPHPLGLVMDLIGPPTSVKAHARSGRVLPHAPTDELRIMLETPAAGGLVTVSLAASPRLEYLHIFGTRGVLHLDLVNQWMVRESVMRGIPKPISRAMTNLRHGWRVLAGTLGGMARVLTKRWTPYVGMAILIREFYASVQGLCDPPVSAADGVRSMEVMDEIWRQIGRDALHWPEGESDDD